MAADPYKYFRIEARELLDGLARGVLQLEKGEGEPDLVQRLLRLAHTLKGAARVVKQPEIAEGAHAVEDVLAQHRDAGGALTAAQSGELLRLVDEMSTRVVTLEASRPAASTGSPAPAPPADDGVAPHDVPRESSRETLRVDMGEMDELARGTAELAVQLGALHRAVDAAMNLGQLQRSLAADVERIGAGLDEVQDLVHRIRLMPADAVFPALERAARDAATALGKRVNFSARGGEVRLDASVLLSVRDALAHIVRNAIAHGIETDEARRAAGKSPAGQVRLIVERRGSRVSFACIDDGSGIDVDAVRRVAVARGHLTESVAATLSPPDVIALLGAGAISTSVRLTELSGRGIGLDVARATAARLKGELTISSARGAGTTVELVVPLSIASMQGLLVESAGARVAIPLDAVRGTRRVSQTELAHASDGDSIEYDGRFIPFVLLERLLPPPTRASAASPTRSATRSWSVVVIRFGERAIALGVDRLHGTSSIVMRALPAFLAAEPILSGASLDADGNPQLVMDPRGLVEAAGHARSVAAAQPAVERAPILVIDDSLTTRMLEQSILESAGYDVETAMSAEEGLEKARARRYSLFVVDVEMPGMSGFDFVSRTRGDPVLRAIPAILVTSRNAPEDRQRGQDAGASAYIVKGEFDQDLLLRQIRRLVGVMPKIRVLVVEDSLTVRKRILEVLGADPDIEVVGEAEDGQRGIELCQTLRPDVVTLDMMLPVMTGLAATEFIMAYCPTPILIVSASTNRGELFKTYEALAAGALDVLEKDLTDSVEEWERRLVSTVKLISRIKVITHPRARLGAAAASPTPSRLAAVPRMMGAPAPRRLRAVGIGVSTGGPAALVKLLRALPTDFPLPLLVVIHIGKLFAPAFAEWLDAQTPIDVSYARDGELLPPVGAPRVLLAPPDVHMVLRRDRLWHSHDAERHSCRPAVDLLFDSLATELGASCAACLLTGMGKDGAEGLLAIRRAGGRTIAQDERTSVVFGMPREAILLGAAEQVLPLDDIAAALVSLARTAGVENGR